MRPRAFLILLLALATPALVSTTIYDSWITMTVIPMNNREVTFIRSLPTHRNYMQKILLVKVPRQKGMKAVLMIKDTKVNDLKMEFLTRRIGNDQWIVHPTNLNAIIDQARKGRVQGVPYVASKYLTVEENYAYLEKLARKYPRLVQLFPIGKTWENRNLIVVKVGRGKGKKPAVWIDAGTHAREWLGPATALYMLSMIVTNKAHSAYLDNVNWYFMPLVNPDGYQFAVKTDGNWRKNRRPQRGWTNCSDTGADIGVDLNRNFDYIWKMPKGASDDMCDEDYRGRGPFSEPESTAVATFIRNHRDIQAYISMHTYSQMWFVPFSSGSKPPDAVELLTLAKAAANALQKVSGTVYTVGHSQELLEYPVSGGSDDWVKASKIVKYVYSLELPPRDIKTLDIELGYMFWPPPNFIQKSGKEMLAAVKVIADTVGRPRNSTTATPPSKKGKPGTRRPRPATSTRRSRGGGNGHAAASGRGGNGQRPPPAVSTRRSRGGTGHAAENGRGGNGQRSG